MKDAKKNGCVLAKLKDDRRTCVWHRIESKELTLAVYDQVEGGRFVRRETLCVPTWYHAATVRFADILGDAGNKRSFVLIEFEGNTGTGTLQKILAVLGWHDGAFRLVLAETVSYKLGCCGDHTNLRVTWRRARSGARPALTLSYALSETRSTAGRGRTTRTEWTEALIWQPERFSFYHEETERKRAATSTIAVEREIAKVRLKLLKLAPAALCQDEFFATGIMEILQGP